MDTKTFNNMVNLKEMNKYIYNIAKVALCGVLVVSCQKEIDTPSLEEGKLVEVSLNIGFDEQVDGYELAQNTRSTAIDRNSAFDFELVPTAKTRAGDISPNKLYNLEIRQYSPDGTYLKGEILTNTELSLGEKLNVPLTEKSDCQLVIVAWGKGANTTTTNLGVGNLASAMNKVLLFDKIKEIPTDAGVNDMNKMPYVLHLNRVKITDSGLIQSIEGEDIDVRLRLKRLAALLTINWTYSVKDFTLKQINLQSIPLDYFIIPNPDKDLNNTYPSLISQFTSVVLTDEEIASGRYSRWIPANVRGNSATANSITNRYKATAPIGSVYVNFVAVNNGKLNTKLDYRVYIGGNDVANFDVFSNTNYTYNVNVNHTGVPKNDKRVTYIDNIPASENNSNFVPTANCFMVAPGGSFYFDPIKFQVGGKATDNTALISDETVASLPTLKNWGEIKYVRLLWQTKENGDVGDPVVGITNSDADHSNIVEYKLGYIYCRVAANTTGGSGVIAAYDGNNKILWSWHLWVTDYKPSATAKETMLTPENGRIHKYGATANLFMDRNLGALNGFMEMPKGGLEMSKANGFHYQRARKDPFPSSYTTQESLGEVYKFTSLPGRPPENVLNRYGADGLTLIIPNSDPNPPTIREAYQNPIQIAAASGYDWGSQAYKTRGDWGTPKGLHDPCPAGWMVPAMADVEPLVSAEKVDTKGGYLIKFDNINSTFFRFTGYPPNSTQLNKVGITGFLIVRDRVSGWPQGYVLRISNKDSPNITIGRFDSYDAHTMRCIQEQ